MDLFVYQSWIAIGWQFNFLFLNFLKNFYGYAIFRILLKCKVFSKNCFQIKKVKKKKKKNETKKTLCKSLDFPNLFSF